LVPDAGAVLRDLGSHLPNATRDWRLRAGRKERRAALTHEHSAGSVRDARAFSPKKPGAAGTKHGKADAQASSAHFLDFHLGDLDT
jgi:hypothetical protein